MVTTFCGQEHLPLKWGVFPQNPLKCVGSKTLEIHRVSNHPWVQIPPAAPTSSQASYRLWRLSFYPFIESHPALITLLLLSPKSLRFPGTPIFFAHGLHIVRDDFFIAFYR